MNITISNSQKYYRTRASYYRTRTNYYKVHAKYFVSYASSANTKLKVSPHLSDATFNFKNFQIFRTSGQSSKRDAIFVGYWMNSIDTYHWFIHTKRCHMMLPFIAIYTTPTRNRRRRKITDDWLLLRTRLTTRNLKN